jgi:thiol-disulfide isomerase/thioredoxin
MLKAKHFFLFSLVYSLGFLNCKNDEGKQDSTKLLVKIQAAYHQKLYLQQQPFNNEKRINLDSAFMQSGLDSFVFYIPSGEQRLFTLTFAESNIRIPIINDAKYIECYYNYATHKCIIKHSPASEELKTFTDEQLSLAKKIRAFKLATDSLQIKKLNSVKDSIGKFNSMTASFFKRYKNFADTVQSPAAFMAVYDAIDFGDDRAGLKSFITSAAKRFPGHSGIQTLAKNVLNYLKIFDEQYKAGDTLPELVLPDQYGINFSTYSLKGKYVLINIWSTLCDDCTKYSEAIKKAKQEFPPSSFEAVNIALDDNKQAWLNTIKERNYNWPQLIDISLWNGTAFKTLKFDSIPYNFLVSPDGVLIKKAIKADSIPAFIQQVIK